MKAISAILIISFLELIFSMDENYVEITGDIILNFTCNDQIYENNYLEFSIPIKTEGFITTEIFTLKLKNPNYVEADCSINGTDLSQSTQDKINCKIDFIKFPYFIDTHISIELPNTFEHFKIINWASFIKKNGTIELENECLMFYNYTFILSKNYLFKYDDDTNKIIFAITGELEENSHLLARESTTFFSISPIFYVDDNYYNESDCAISENKGKLPGNYVMVCYLNVKEKIQIFPTITPVLYELNYILINSSSKYTMKACFTNYSKFSGIVLILLYLII